MHFNRFFTYSIIYVIFSVGIVSSQTFDRESYARWKAAYIDSIRATSHTDRTSLRREMYINTSNRYVDGVLDEESGEYEVGADPDGGSSYMMTTFSYDSPPGTSWIMYKVDDSELKTNEDMPLSSRSYTTTDGQAVVEWNNVDGVKIVQTINAVQLGTIPGENEQIRFRTYITSADGECHQVGAIVYFDTDLNYDDAARISTAFGYTDRSEIFYSPDMPAIWRAYELSYPPAPGRISTLGILTGFEAVTPDVFWYGQWGSSVSNGYEDSEWSSITGSIFTDSAAMIKWYQRIICPGDTLIYCTYYGIGNLLASSVYFTHITPELNTDCDLGVSPNPFTITSMVVNAGTSNAINTMARLILPTGMTAESGSNPFIVGVLPGYGGSVYANWDVTIDPALFGTTQNYTIQVIFADAAHPTEYDTISTDYVISIPAGPFNISVSSDEDSICLGDSTLLHLTINAQGSTDFAIHWFPPEFVSDPYGTDVWAFPESTTVFYALVSDELGCERQDFTPIAIINPPEPPYLTTPVNNSTFLNFGNTDLIWEYSIGHEPITYSVYINDLLYISDLVDTSFSFISECSMIYDWYVVATNNCGSTPSEHSVFSTIPCGNPEAFVVDPVLDSWTACANQVISIRFEDDYDIDSSSVVISVNSQRYSWPHPTLSFSSDLDTLYFTPDFLFIDGMNVQFTLENTTNIYGVPIIPISSNFFVDLTPPVFSNFNPISDQMVLNSNPTISFDVDDNYLEVLDSSITLRIIDFDRSFDISSPFVSYNNGHFIFNTANSGVKFVNGDTICIEVSADDLPDYCAGNHGSDMWCFNIEPTIYCEHQPNPFTPNMDINDNIYFNYPFIFSKHAVIKIFTLKHELVFEQEFKPIDNWDTGNYPFWDGTDDKGELLAPGLYLYIITEDNEVVCQGTITLVR